MLRRGHTKDESTQFQCEQIVHQIADLRIMKSQIETLEQCLEGIAVQLGTGTAVDPELNAFIISLGLRLKRKAASLSERIRVKRPAAAIMAARA